MDRTRGVVVGTAVVIVVVTALSGPLVPGVTLAKEPEPVAFETGNVTVSEVTLPDTATIERGSYGAANYHLRVPPATVRFGTLVGNPTLVYRLDIDELGYARITNHFLDESVGDAYEVTMRPDTLTKGEINQMAYSGVLTVVKRDDSGEGVIAERNVTVEVVE